MKLQLPIQEVTPKDPHEVGGKRRNANAFSTCFQGSVLKVLTMSNDTANATPPSSVTDFERDDPQDSINRRSALPESVLLLVKIPSIPG